VQGFSQVSVRFPLDDTGSYSSMFGTVRGIDTTRDLAAVQLSHSMPILPTRVVTTDDIGTPIIQVGYSAGTGVYPVVHAGVIANVQRHLGPVIEEAATRPDRGDDTDGVGVVIFDADADPGDSGGPVLDLDGVVVAITFGSTTESGGKRVLGQQRGTSLESVNAVWDDLKDGINTSSQ
jgi:S1-C subfamily serine protease